MSKKKETKPDPPGKLVNTQQTEAYREQLRVLISFCKVLTVSAFRKRNVFLLEKRRRTSIDLIIISKRTITTYLYTLKTDFLLTRPK